MATRDLLHSKRLLVTGGYGFIGSHLVRRLVGTGARITVLSKQGEPLWRLARYAGSFETASLDITDTDAVTALFARTQPEGVFHLAAYGVDSAFQDIVTAANVNVMGTANVLKAMRASGCPRIVTMGSGAEYGNHEGLIREDASLHPENAYASTKAAATLIAHQFAAQHGIGIVTLRPFGVYGEAEPPHKIFCHAILTMLRGDDLDLTPCTQQRDYCYVEDIVDALIASFTHTVNDIFNVGTGDIRPLRDYIEKIAAVIQPSGRIRYGALPYRSNEVWAPAPDISRIQERLKWRPAHTLEQGIEKTIGWYQKNSHLYSKTD